MVGHRSWLVLSAEVQSPQRKTEGCRGQRRGRESLGKARAGEQLEVIYTEASSAGINHTLSTHPPTHPEQCQWRNAARVATQSVNLWPTTCLILNPVSHSCQKAFKPETLKCTRMYILIFMLYIRHWAKQSEGSLELQWSKNEIVSTSVQKLFCRNNLPCSMLILWCNNLPLCCFYTLMTFLYCF